MLQNEYRLTDWEDRLIEERELWLDVIAIPGTSYETKRKNEIVIDKGYYYENKSLAMEFLESGKRTRSFDYETAREANYQAYVFEQVIERYHLNARVKHNGTRVTLTKTRSRG